MISYAIVGTNDLSRAKAFYGPLFAHLGFSLRHEEAEFASWGDRTDDRIPRFFVSTPYDERPATVGNGTMTAFRAETASAVDALYAIALENGGSDEGKPGFRPESYGDRFYVAYVRDPDGNKLAFTCFDGKANP